MSLLAPAFLFGLLAIAIPLWLHRLQIQSTEREKFSSTMLLEASEKRIHTRKKLRFLLLLALRIFLLTVLAFAFAKPIIERSGQQQLESGGALHILVVDTSFSMGQGDRFESAIGDAVTLVNGLPAGDAAWVVSASRGTDLVAGQETEITSVPGVLRSLSVGAGRLDFGNMMENINTIMAGISSGASNVIVHIFSDFQASAVPARFSDLLPDPVYEKEIALEFHPVGVQADMNARVDYVIADQSGVEVGVRSASVDIPDIPVRLDVNGTSIEEMRVPLDESGLGTVRFEGMEYEKGDNRIEAWLTQGDSLPGDDRYHSVFENSPPVPMLLLTADPDSRSVLYLRSALESGSAGYSAEVVDIRNFDPRTLSRYPWIAIDDIGILDEAAANSIRQYLESGGALLAAMGRSAAAREDLPVTGNSIGSILDRRSVYNVSQIDTSHPVMAKTSGWQSVNVLEVLPVATGAGERVLVGLNDNRPLVIEGDVGLGRYLLLTTSLDNQWNDLPIHPVFVNFTNEAARFLARDELTQRQLIVGDTITLRQAGFASGQVMGPGGERVLELADTLRAQNVVVTSTGYYEVFTSGSEFIVAVNVDSRESELEPMTDAQMDAWQDAASGSGQAAEDTGSGTMGTMVTENPPIEIWRWVLLILLMTIIVESVLGNRYLVHGSEASQ